MEEKDMLDYEKLKKLVTSGKYKNIEDLLRDLKATYPDYFRFHILMHTSLSLHSATYTHPRAIIFGPEARFILAFNDMGQNAGNALEVVQYNNVAKKFEFREIAFKYNDPNFKKNIPASDIEIEAEEYYISRANPQKCKDCHGKLSTPVWTTHFLWPGAFGSNDDLLQAMFDQSSHPLWLKKEFESGQIKKPTSQHHIARLKDGKIDTELQGAIAFYKTRKGHPRYKYLPTTILEKGLKIYDDTKEWRDFSEEAIVERKRLYPLNGSAQMSIVYPSSLNFYLFEALNFLNQDRIVDLLEKTHLKSFFFENKDWDWVLGNKYYDTRRNFTIDTVVDLVSNSISRSLENGRLKSLPSDRSLLRKKFLALLKSQADYQIERMEQHLDNFEKDSLYYYMDPTNAQFHNFNNLWIKDPVKFFSDLTGRKPTGELEKMAFSMPTEDLIKLFVVSLVLEDGGIVLNEYSMNYQQKGMTFYHNGVEGVGQFLGLTP